MTCVTRGSAARAKRSRRSSSLTLSASASEPSGSCGAYRAGRPRPASMGAAFPRHLRGDRARRPCRAQQRRHADVVGIGERRLLAADGAHADALVDVEAAGLDDALLQAPGLGARVLEIEVGVIDAVAEHLAEHAGELPGRQVVRRQQVLLGGAKKTAGVLGHEFFRYFGGAPSRQRRLFEFTVSDDAEPADWF